MHEPKVPVRTYVGVYVALMALMALTTGLAFVDLAAWSATVAMAIAGAKAVLVILWFMHVRYGTKMTWVFAGVGFYFVGILFFLTLNDVLTRSWLSPFLGGAP
jgi:cytochrome c oxidase subunit 4